MPHIHEKYDFVVNAIIVYENKVLLVNHPRYGKWLPVGGHVELDEDPEQALFREVKEESGLEVEVLNTKPDISDLGVKKILFTPNFIDVHEANPPHKHICLNYFVRAKNNNHRLSDEHSDIRWLSEEDLDKPEYDLSSSIKFYCREALEQAKKTPST